MSVCVLIKRGACIKRGWPVSMRVNSEWFVYFEWCELSVCVFIQRVVFFIKSSVACQYAC